MSVLRHNMGLFSRMFKSFGSVVCCLLYVVLGSDRHGDNSAEGREEIGPKNKRGVATKGGSYREQLTLECCTSAAAAPPITAEIAIEVTAAPHARRAVLVATGGDIWRGFLQRDCGGGDEDDGDDGGDRPRLFSDAALCLVTVIPILDYEAS